MDPWKQWSRCRSCNGSRGIRRQRQTGRCRATWLQPRSLRRTYRRNECQQIISGTHVEVELRHRVVSHLHAFDEPVGKIVGVIDSKHVSEGRRVQPRTLRRAINRMTHRTLLRRYPLAVFHNLTVRHPRRCAAPSLRRCFRGRRPSRATSKECGRTKDSNCCILSHASPCLQIAGLFSANVVRGIRLVSLHEMRANRAVSAAPARAKLHTASHRRSPDAEHAITETERTGYSRAIP